MLIRSDTQAGIETLSGTLVSSRKPSAGLFAKIFAASPRLVSLRAMGKAGRLDRLVASEAWTDAALELVGLEVPGWSMQRLCLDDGEWLCTLTRFPDVPDWLDDSAEGRHLVMALAILSAVLDVRARAKATSPAAVRQLAGLSADYR